MARPPWNHNIHYHPLVLGAIPEQCERALDIGCGRGLLARKLAERCARVVAIDPDADTLVHARGLGDADRRIEYVLGDVMQYPFARDDFDFIAAVATLHHLPLEPALKRFAELLRPGGVLAVIGLARASEPMDYLFAAASVPAHWVLRWLRGNTDVGAPLQDPKETFRDIRLACDAVLPDAELRRLLLFRYWLTWRKR